MAMVLVSVLFLGKCDYALVFVSLSDHGKLVQSARLRARVGKQYGCDTLKLYEKLIKSNRQIYT